MNLAVSIVSYNTKNLLNGLLETLFKESVVQELEVWVLDNNSTDGSTRMVEKKFKKVNLIKNPTNVGFAKGQNIIFKKINSKYALLLNPDTILQLGSINQLIKFMDKNPDCAVAGVRINDLSHNLTSNGGDLPFGIALISWLFNLENFGNFPNFHRTDKKYYEKIHQVGWVAGTFMVVRSEVFKKIGYLNEDYFMYFEDVEFCYRTLKAGFKVMINPEIIVRHVGGASSKDPGFNQWKGEFLGLLKFYGQNFGPPAAFLIRLLIYLAIILRIIGFTFLGKFPIAKTYGRIIYEI